MATTVAVVDDDTAVRRSMARLLAAYAFEARAYASAREFIDTLDAQVPACLILDLQMPGMDGLELMRYLRDAGVTIPIIVVTAQEDIAVCERCMAAGAMTILSKPVRGEDLIAVIETAIGGRTTQCKHAPFVAAPADPPRRTRQQRS